jgi:exported heavy-metal binding protein
MKKVLFLFVFLCSVLGAAAKNLQQVVFKVEQMVCVNCEAKVKRNIPYEKGVKNMKTDVENHTVTVTFDADVTNVANLQKGFAKFGYKAEVLQPAAPVKAQKK